MVRFIKVYAYLYKYWLVCSVNTDDSSKMASKFLEVRCPSCGNGQVIFNKASTIVKCNMCGNILAIPSGGKAKIRVEVIEVH